MKVNKPVWRIYYINNEAFSNLDGGPEEAPGDGCLAIAQIDQTTGYRITHGGGPHYGHGFYWWEKEHWFIGDIFGLQQYMAEPGWKKVILGRTVLQDEWQNLIDRVEADFGPKSSYWLHEPRRER